MFKRGQGKQGELVEIPRAVKNPRGDRGEGEGRVDKKIRVKSLQTRKVPTETYVTRDYEGD